MVISYATDFTATQTGNWTDVATWGGAGVPGANDNVNTAGFTITIAENVACANLTFTSLAGKFVTNLGVTLTVRGKVDCTATGTLDASSTMDATAI